MTDPDAAGGGGEYEVVVGKSLHPGLPLSISYTFLSFTILLPFFVTP